MTHTETVLHEHYQLTPGSDPLVRLQGHARASLASLYHRLGFRNGAEIGVWNGEHAEILCQYNPEVRLLCIDAWEDFAHRSRHPKPEAFVKVRLETERRMTKYPGAVIIKAFNEDAARNVADGSLDFVFIDAAHGYTDVIRDLKTWSPKVRSGGIVSGHDYETTALGWPPENGVKEAVHEFIDGAGIRPLYLLMGTPRDRWKSYFWVQP